MKFALVVFATVVPLAAQDFRIPSSFDKFAARAKEMVDVNLDGSLLQLAARFLSDGDADEAQVKKLVSGLKGIFVKSYEFESRGEYTEADLESLRSQLKSPGWSRIVGVRSQRSGENADVYLRSDGNSLGGLVVITSEPRRLTVVNINGSINPDDIRRLGGHFGIPKLDGIGNTRRNREN
jgi:hypothetical protein